MASVAAQVAMTGGVDESVLIQGTSSAVSKTAANLSLAKLGYVYYMLCSLVSVSLWT